MGNTGRLGKFQMNEITTYLLKAHVVLSMLLTLLDSLSDSIITEAKNIAEHQSTLTKSGANFGGVGADISRSRNKRNVLQFGNMISCIAGKNALEYTDYGCYCGIGGTGKPKDDIDWCCFDHDLCWKYVMDDPECTGLSSPYLINYDWGCSTTGSAHCYDAENSCDRRTCECDRIASECFGRHEYHTEYYDLDPWTECNSTFEDTRHLTTTTEIIQGSHSSSSTLLPFTSLYFPLIVSIVTCIAMATSSPSLTKVTHISSNTKR